MNFLVGLLLRVAVQRPGQILSFDKEEEVFWLFVCLMDYDGLRDFYREGFPLLLKYTVGFFDLMKLEIPDLHRHFEGEKISPSLFLHQWYLSLFINCLPFPTVLILWDSIICEGLPVILSLSVSLLKVLKGVLLKMEFEQIIRFFKTMKNGDEECDAKIIGQLLVKQAALISIPKDVLRSLDPSAPVPPGTSGMTTSGSSGMRQSITSPWAMPILPIVFEDSTVRSDSPTLFERIQSAFSWGVNYNSGDD
jgi:hypothetical protein